MRLIRFGANGAEKPGVIIDGKRRDCSLYFEDWNRNFFNEDGLDKLSELVQKIGRDLPPVPADTRWGSCIARPSMILCIGLNYSDHALESGMEVPVEPVLFTKASNTISGPFDEITIPKGSQKTDWEVELAIVVRKDILYLESETEANKSIAGYCVMNDLSEREFQIERGGQWVKGKSCPGFSPLGPYLVTPDEIEDVKNLKMKLSVNGQVMQNSSTSKMIFKPDYLLHYITQFMQLEAGDIVTTGTPAGVGLGMNPQKFILPGDSVELSIQNLGTQKQHFIAYK